MLENMNKQEEVEVIEYDELETEASFELHCLCGLSSGSGS